MGTEKHGGKLGKFMSSSKRIELDNDDVDDDDVNNNDHEYCHHIHIYRALISPTDDKHHNFKKRF